MLTRFLRGRTALFGIAVFAHNVERTCSLAFCPTSHTFNQPPASKFPASYFLLIFVSGFLACSSPALQPCLTPDLAFALSRSTLVLACPRCGSLLSVPAGVDVGLPFVANTPRGTEFLRGAHLSPTTGSESHGASALKQVDRTFGPVGFEGMARLDRLQLKVPNRSPPRPCPNNVCPSA
jgi:hypothetical protein